MPSRDETIDPAPWAPLLADHDVARAVLRAMEEEARRLYDGAPLRPSFWERAAAFVVGFLEGYHRKVEEQVLFPVLVALGDDETRHTVTELIRDHWRGHEMTDTLAQGIRDGDWESVLRSAMIYVSVTRQHMLAEERMFAAIGHRRIARSALVEIHEKMEALAQRGLGPRGRVYFAELAASLCAGTGVEGPSAWASAS